MSSKGIKIDGDDIEACHPLPRRNKLIRPAVIMRFVNRKRKKEVIRQGNKLKGTNVYINEHLTAKTLKSHVKPGCLKRKRKFKQCGPPTVTSSSN